ncbi:PspC domain-containing protein [Latilactobacillus curvatus]
MGKRLYKSRDNKMISGVMGGIAEYFNIDATLVRILYVVFSVFSAAFPGIVVYIILAMVIPERPRQSKHDSESEWSEF